MRGRDPLVMEAPWDEHVFEAVSDRSAKIKCRRCGATGYPEQLVRYSEDEQWLENIAWWGRDHIRGHGWDCRYCPMAFTTPQGLSAHLRYRHATL